MSELEIQENMSAEEVAQITYNNAIKIFKINVN